MANEKEKQTQSNRAADLLLANPIVLVTLLAALLFALTRGAFGNFYSAYDVSPDEIGLDYQAILVREAFPVVLLVFFVAIFLSPVLLYRARFRAWERRKRQSRSPEESVDELLDIREAVSRRTLLMGTVAAALVVVGWTGLLFLQTSRAQVGPYRPTAVFAPLQADVFRVRVLWLSNDTNPPGRPLSWADLGVPASQYPQCEPDMLYLGKANGIAVFYETTLRFPVRLPADKVYEAGPVGPQGCGT